MNTMLSFNVDHWSWVTANEQQMANHESQDIDLDELVQAFTTTLELETEEL